MLLVSHKVVFIEKIGLLCVTKRESARAFAATILGITF